MRVSVVVGGVAAAAALALIGARFGVPAASSAPAAKLPPAARAGEYVFYGHLKSLTKSGARYQLRVDPAWWLTGVTAQKAAVADKAIKRGEAVPNDYYIVDESHRLLTYLVPASTHVAALVDGTRMRTITVPALARVLRGAKTPHLSEPKAGYWIRVYGDTVRSLDQQYQP